MKALELEVTDVEVVDLCPSGTYKGQDKKKIKGEGVLLDALPGLGA